MSDLNKQQLHRQLLELLALPVEASDEQFFSQLRNLCEQKQSEAAGQLLGGGLAYVDLEFNTKVAVAYSKRLTAMCSDHLAISQRYRLTPAYFKSFSGIRLGALYCYEKLVAESSKCEIDITALCDHLKQGDQPYFTMLGECHRYICFGGGEQGFSKELAAVPPLPKGDWLSRYQRIKDGLTSDELRMALPLKAALGLCLTALEQHGRFVPDASEERVLDLAKQLNQALPKAPQATTPEEHQQQIVAYCEKHGVQLEDFIQAIQEVPKALTHEHLEGTIAPEGAARLICQSQNLMPEDAFEDFEKADIADREQIAANQPFKPLKWVKRQTATGWEFGLAVRNTAAARLDFIPAEDEQSCADYLHQHKYDNYSDLMDFLYVYNSISELINPPMADTGTLQYSHAQVVKDYAKRCVQQGVSHVVLQSDAQSHLPWPEVDPKNPPTTPKQLDTMAQQLMPRFTAIMDAYHIQAQKSLSEDQIEVKIMPCFLRDRPFYQLEVMAKLYLEYHKQHPGRIDRIGACNGELFGSLALFSGLLEQLYDGGLAFIWAPHVGEEAPNSNNAVFALQQGASDLMHMVQPLTGRTTTLESGVPSRQSGEPYLPAIRYLKLVDGAASRSPISNAVLLKLPISACQDLKLLSLGIPLANLSGDDPPHFGAEGCQPALRLFSEQNAGLEDMIRVFQMTYTGATFTAMERQKFQSRVKEVMEKSALYPRVWQKFAG